MRDQLDADVRRPTISQVLVDNDVMTASNLAAVKVDAKLAHIKAEIGLTDR